MNRANFIFKLYPQIVTIRGDVAYDANDNVVEYDPALVDAEIAKTEYQRQRAAEYPSFADQFDMLWHAIDSNTLDKESQFYKTLAEVKAKYAKTV